MFGLAVVGALVFVGVWGMTRKKKSDGSEQPLLEEEDEWAPIGGANPGVRDRIRSKVCTACRIFPYWTYCPTSAAGAIF